MVSPRGYQKCMIPVHYVFLILALDWTGRSPSNGRYLVCCSCLLHFVVESQKPDVVRLDLLSHKRLASVQRNCWDRCSLWIEAGSAILNVRVWRTLWYLEPVGWQSLAWTDSSSTGHR